MAKTIYLYQSDACVSWDVLSWRLIRISIKTSAMISKSIDGAANASRSTIEGMGTDHRRFDIVKARGPQYCGYNG